MTWPELVERQDGVLARHQALAGGITRHEWAWKLRRGVWQLALPGVAIAHSGGTTDRQRAWVAALHGGRGAVVSGDAALSLSGLNIPRLKAIDVAVPRDRRVRGGRLRGDGALDVTVHRVERPERWARELRGLPVVTAHAAVLHAASWAGSERDAEWRIAAAVQRGITAVPSIRAALAQMPTLKRRALVTEVLDDVAFGAHAGSELQFLRFLRAQHLPRPDEMQVLVRVGAVHYLDARYRRQRVTVEIDGAHHRDVATWEADALRALRLVASMPGECVVRLTTGMLRRDAEEVARLLRSILA